MSLNGFHSLVLIMLYGLVTSNLWGFVCGSYEAPVLSDTGISEVHSSRRQYRDYTIDLYIWCERFHNEQFQMCNAIPTLSLFFYTIPIFLIL